MSPDCSCIFTWQIWEWLIFSSQQESKSAYFPERQTIPFNIWSRLRINQFTICLFLDRSVQCVTLSCGPCDEYDLLFLWNSMLCCVYMGHFQQSLDLSVCPSDFQRVQEELRSPKDRELKQPNLVNICPFFFLWTWTHLRAEGLSQDELFMSYHQFTILFIQYFGSKTDTDEIFAC